MKLTFSKSALLAVVATLVLFGSSKSAMAEPSLMRNYEQLRKRTEVNQPKEKKVRDLLTLVSYQMGLVSLAPILTRTSDGNNKLPRLGVTVTMPLGRKGV